MAMFALKAKSLYFLFCLVNLCKQYFFCHIWSLILFLLIRIFKPCGDVALERATYN